MKTWAQATLTCFLLIIVTSITYQESLNNQLLTLWDDQGYVTNNEQIRTLNWDTIQWFFTHIQMHNWHPLTSISYAIDYQFWDLNAWGYHFTNVVFHSANVIWFFFAAWLLFNIYQPKNSYNLIAAGLSALLFAIHPQHVESVAWISERKDVLFLFFTFPTLIAYIYYVRTQHYFYYFIALACFICALLSKPMAVTLPAVLILIDIFPLQRTQLTHITLYAASYTKILLEKLLFIILSIGAVIVTLLAQRFGNEQDSQPQLLSDDGIQFAGGAIQSLEQLSIIERLLNASNSLVHYLTKLVFPLQLSPYYDLPDQFGIVPVFVVLAVSLLCLYLWFKKYYAGLIIWLFYVGTLIPVIGLVQVGGQAAADRYAYLPLLPFYLLMGYFFTKYLYQYFNQNKYVYLSIIAIVGILVIYNLSMLTQKQILVWRNDYSLWKHVYLYDPQNDKAAVNLAALYSRAGDMDAALHFYKTAIQAKPDVLANYNFLAEFYVKQGKVDDALVIYEMMDEKGLIHEKGSIAITYFNMAMLYLKKNQIDKAIYAAKNTLIRDPNHEQALAFIRDYLDK
ncbi:tetratricopeptide repeat protein [Candidatus Albibeggiatoa sp. nov. NOAA]|uniref:tetratricopeptide repeat protein n=1 Tax=Candidatus Albibeggiatoa sp. nov. NOAA TaxID=3162724 RepID=UPI0032F8A9FD|nr:tetratricopeptide repeat protein [Thiotrichaceae bacterium]